MQVNPEDGPPEINVTWSDPRMTDFENFLKMSDCPTGPTNFDSTGIHVCSYQARQSNSIPDALHWDGDRFVLI